MIDMRLELYCAGCKTKVNPRLTDGSEIYPHRKDLYELPFWKCDYCNNYVGCHYKTKDRTRPLGCIPTKELKNARRHIHKLLDPIWKNKKMKRKRLYSIISEKVGWEYHTANIRDLSEARKIYKIINDLTNQQKT